MPNINLFDTYVLLALVEEVAPVTTFFRDRYFPTGEEDIFMADKVLTEYMKGDCKMAAFVSERAGAIPVEREGYEIREYQPANISLSRHLTVDDLKKRCFGEALYHNLSQAQRATKLQLKDLTDLDKRITRREEWMCVQTMINNYCEMQEYIDAKTKGEKRYVHFYDNVTEHLYTVSNVWNSVAGKFIADVTNACLALSSRSLPAEDLVVGADVAQWLLTDETMSSLLDKNSGIITGLIDQKLLPKYPGVTYMGRLNFGGFWLNIFAPNHTYKDDNGKTQKYFPATSAMVTAPNCGHLMYGQVTQIDYGNDDFTSHAGSRIPRAVVDQAHNKRAIELASRPLAAPVNYSPYIYMSNVVG